MRGGRTGRMLGRRFARQDANQAGGRTPVEKIRQGEPITWSEAARVLTEGRVERPLGWDWYAWNWFVSLLPTAVICLMAMQGRKMMEENRKEKASAVESRMVAEEEVRHSGLKSMQERMDFLEQQFASLRALLEGTRSMPSVTESPTTSRSMPGPQETEHAEVPPDGTNPSTKRGRKDARNLLDWIFLRRVDRRSESPD